MFILPCNVKSISLLIDQPQIGAKIFALKFGKAPTGVFPSNDYLEF